jgi:hypothetical protein
VLSWIEPDKRANTWFPTARRYDVDFSKNPMIVSTKTSIGGFCGSSVVLDLRDFFDFLTNSWFEASIQDCKRLLNGNTVYVNEYNIPQEHRNQGLPLHPHSIAVKELNAAAVLLPWQPLVVFHSEIAELPTF